MNLTVDQVFRLPIVELYRVGKSGMLVVKDLNRGRKVIKKKYNKYGFNMYDFDVSGWQGLYYFRLTRYRVVKKRGPNSIEYSEPDINIILSIPKDHYKGTAKVSILKRNSDFTGYSYEKFIGWEETLESVVRDKL